MAEAHDLASFQCKTFLKLWVIVLCEFWACQSACSGLPASTACWIHTSFAFARHKICSPNSTFSVQLPVHCHQPPPILQSWQRSCERTSRGIWDMGDDRHMATLWRRQTEGVLNGLTPQTAISPILTSSMQAIRKDRRQKLCGTQQSQDKQERYCVTDI